VESRFEVAAISVDWTVLIVAGILRPSRAIARAETSPSRWKSRSHQIAVVKKLE
jgi:hypothetical protein